MHILKTMMRAIYALVLLGATAAAAESTPRILTMGDSLMATHRADRQSVSDAIARTIGVPVTNRSVSGARMIYNLPISGSLGMRISKQFRAGDWDWVVLNGGGNDLMFGCGCHRCDRRLSRLIDARGQLGEIPNLVQRLRKTGAQVIYVGYLRSPGFGSPIESCLNEGQELERRINQMAAQDSGVHFVSLADLVPAGDTSFHEPDRVHPSPKGSRAIGERIARVILRK